MSAPRWVVFDVDDVVLDMDHLSQEAERAVQVALTPVLGAAPAARVYEGLHRSYATLRDQLRSSERAAPGGHDRLLSRLAGWQRGVLEAGYELKQWSRQGLLAVAFEDAGLPVARAPVALGARAYWGAVAAGTRILPDARRAVERARAAGVGVHFATNSDGWLGFDAEQDTLRYDPAVAVREKLGRLGALLALGFGPEDVTVGDPVGKPHRAFFERVMSDIAAKSGGAVDVASVGAVGDSLTHDVLPLMRMGASRGAWILRRGAPPTPAPVPEAPGVWRIRSLDELEGLGLFG